MFKKATKTKSKLREALFGPSGSGKTYSALRMATGMGGKIALIDTEHGSASKYADKFEFDVCELNDDKSITATIKTIADAKNYDILIIDSLTHSWQELMEEVDHLAKTKYRGNSWSAWSDGTPKQKKLVGAILSFPGHVIATMRSKTEWTTETDIRGKTKPVRIGLSPEQGKGIEYEFDMLMELNTEHQCLIIKDRTGEYQDKNVGLLTEEFGAELMAWLGKGKNPEVQQPEEETITPEPEEKPATDPNLKDKFIADFFAAAKENEAKWSNKKDVNHFIVDFVTDEMGGSLWCTELCTEKGHPDKLNSKMADNDPGWTILSLMCAGWDFKKSFTAARTAHVLNKGNTNATDAA